MSKAQPTRWVMHITCAISAGWRRMVLPLPLCIFLLHFGIAVLPIHAQTTLPSGAPVAAGRLENQPLRTAGRPDPLPGDPAPSPESPPLDFSRMLLALGAVIALILLLRWGGRRLFGPAISAGPTRAVRVLSRSVVSPRQQVLLVQVGRRVLVLADNAGQLRPLSEIADADEVAELMGQVGQEKGDAVVRSFGSLFKKQSQTYDAGPSAQPPTPSPSGAPDGRADATEEPSDESIGVTRQEISGLMDKVKLLSRQFQR